MTTNITSSIKVTKEVQLLETIKSIYINGFTLKTLYKQNKEDLLLNNSLNRIFKKTSEIERKLKSYPNLPKKVITFYLSHLSIEERFIINAIDREYLIKFVKNNLLSTS
jgi:hypothetical protein